ncbi:unnamed protein product [marine sediment metagenome]|uniref:Uncharacterized protein n=1 Tax=marine sediment metagenome TaxID=412755 RepID=X1NGY6_9ZZZZ
MSKRVFTEEAKILAASSIFATKTAAGHFARGWRRRGRWAELQGPRGSVRVEPVGKYWGVFDYDPEPGVPSMTIEEGIELGKRLYG